MKNYVAQVSQNIKMNLCGTKKRLSPTAPHEPALVAHCFFYGGLLRHVDLEKVALGRHRHFPGMSAIVDRRRLVSLFSPPPTTAGTGSFASERTWTVDYCLQLSGVESRSKDRWRKPPGRSKTGRSWHSHDDLAD
jgi:hypothetical protein